jgi:hypothetical protein
MARDQALEQQHLAEAMVDTARASLISQLCERADALGQRIDAFERRRMRDYLDSLPNPDNPDDDPATHHPTGALHSLGPVEERYPAPETEIDTVDARDQIPPPKDPTGVSLQRR